MKEIICLRNSELKIVVKDEESANTLLGYMAKDKVESFECYGLMVEDEEYEELFKETEELVAQLQLMVNVVFSGTEIEFMGDNKTLVVKNNQRNKIIDTTDKSCEELGVEILTAVVEINK